MNNNDKNKFMDLIGGIGLIFDKNINEIILKLYFEGLQDFTIEQIENAIKQILKTNKFFPKIAEIRNILEGDLNIKDGESDLALILLEKSFKISGDYIDCIFENPHINKTIKFISNWHDLLNEEDWKFKRNEFKSIYQSLKKDDYKLNKILGKHNENNPEQSKHKILFIFNSGEYLELDAITKLQCQNNLLSEFDELRNTNIKVLYEKYNKYKYVIDKRDNIKYNIETIANNGVFCSHKNINGIKKIIWEYIKEWIIE
jgi:uncharacterized protein YdcH (DUF465 family)